MNATTTPLLTPGVPVRLWRFTASHNRLSLRQQVGDAEAEIELVMCALLHLPPSWIAGEVVVTRHGEHDIRISDGVLDVICAEAQRWHKWETDEQPVVSLNRHRLA